MNQLRRLKLVFVVVGMAAAGVAVATDNRRITWVAIAFLAAALAIRLVDRQGTPPRQQ